MPRRIAIVLSTVFSVRGGIPRFNQMLCRAVDQLGAELDLAGSVLSLHDTLEDYRDHGPPWERLRFIPGSTQSRILARTAAVCLRERHDLLLIGLIGMTPIGALLRPVVRNGFGFVAHGIDAWEEPRLSRRLSVRRARVAFAVSQHTGESLVRSMGVSRSRIRWLPNTLDPAFDSHDPTPGRADDEGPELLTVTRLWADEHRKGVDHTLTVLAGLFSRYPMLRYRIVGKGSDKPRLVSMAASLGLAERVIFEEDLSDTELAERYRRCDVFVLPSGQEGFGIVFLEAMRYGKPCIGGREGGTPEVIKEGETGFLVPFGDAGALESALTRLLDSPSLRRRMGDSGRQRLSDEFSFDRFRARLGSYLQEWLEEGPRTGGT